MPRALLAVALATAVCGLAAAPASAASTYCSSTGDVCYAARRQAGVVRLRLDTFSFSGPVRVCVTPPRGARTCRSFQLFRRAGGLRGMNARWSAHFTNQGAGRYRVRFFAGGSALGPSVSFTRRSLSYSRTG
jgi:hypothetical protein